MTSPDRDEERTQESPDAGQLDQEFADERSEDGGPASESEQEETREPVQQPLDLDLGLQRLSPPSGQTLRSFLDENHPNGGRGFVRARPMAAAEPESAIMILRRPVANADR